MAYDRDYGDPRIRPSPCRAAATIGPAMTFGYIAALDLAGPANAPPRVISALLTIPGDGLTILKLRDNRVAAH